MDPLTPSYSQTRLLYIGLLGDRGVWLLFPLFCAHLDDGDIMSVDVVLSRVVPHRGALKANPDPVDHQ